MLTDTLEVAENVVDVIDTPSDAVIPSDTIAETVETEETTPETHATTETKETPEPIETPITNANKNYTTNNEKELLVLQYLENFDRQYTLLYPGRKQLLLTIQNECLTTKFISTFIRPTQSIQYDYTVLCKFISDYVQYQPLKVPHQLPMILNSPTRVLEIQKGNCFEMAVLLCSLLIGVGYDAYVVSGYALKSITCMDQSLIVNNDLYSAIPSDDTTVKETIIQQNKYKVKKPKSLTSAFLAKQKEKQKVMVLAAQARQLKKEPVVEVEDELRGLRVHAWVLILPGKRQISEPFFIEPSTGIVHDCESDVYLGVESVFNNTNCWVNMQICYDGLKGISFDLQNTTKWEFVILDHSNTGDQSDDEEEVKEVVDVPPSWVDQINITKEMVDAKHPLNQKTNLYKNAREWLYAEYFRKDGMVRRIEFFECDEKYAGYVVQVFANRKDRITHRVIKGEVVQEYFSPGRQHGLKHHILVNGKTKTMEFYASARPDGLVKRTEDERKIIYDFEGRDDFLVYRSITYELVEEVRGPLFKITEKYARNEDLPVSQDIAKKTFFLKEDRIKIVFHLEEGRIVHSFREFRKPGDGKPTLDQDFINDPFANPPKQQFLLTQFIELMKCESNAVHAMKTYERELSECLATRHAEESDIVLTVSIYDTVRNETTLPLQDETVATTTSDHATVEIDYLSPFLLGLEGKVKEGLSRDEAMVVKEQALKSLRDRLVEKAGIIQSRLDSVTMEYQRRQLTYSRNADTMNQEETQEYVTFCNDALFKIHILEKRLAKHKEVAPERYIEMDTRLKNDKRLAGAF